MSVKQLNISIIIYVIRNVEGFLLGASQTLSAQLQRLAAASGLQIRVRIGKLFSSFPIQNMCCGYSKEPSQRDGF